ncbi:hypothetical protein ACFO3D_13755 [Virgibacillus kekensis]|uniref:Uncharacterized protein n=1 Tax=Virgibacillus kekensis TaxID=202261 RepID=A0ABV9DKB5_9BACI
MRELAREKYSLRVSYVMMLFLALVMIGAWLYDTVPELTSAKNIEENLIGVFDKRANPVANLEIIGHKQVDDNRIVLYSADNRPGIAVYKKTLLNDIYRIQHIDTARKVLSTFRLEHSSSKNYVIVYGNTTITTADSYHITIGDFHVVNEMPEQGYTFHILGFVNENAFQRPNLLLYNGKDLVMNKLYTD